MSLTQLLQNFPDNISAAEMELVYRKSGVFFAD